MGKLTISVFLLSQSISEPTEAVDVSGMSSVLAIPLGDGSDGELYYGVNSSKPHWFEELSTLAKSQQALDVQSATGVLTAKIGSRCFLISFGHGWQKIDRSKIVRNFGIRCVLNLSPENALRGIRRDRIATKTIQAIEQIPDNDDISRFGMDVYRDILRGVRAQVDDNHGFGDSVSGSDSFKATVDLSKEGLHSFLVKCLNVYDQDSYTKRFKWVDNIFPIKDEKIIKRLYSSLLKGLVHNPSGYVLCMPTLVNWDAYDIVSFERKKRGASPVAYQFTIDAAMEFLLSRSTPLKMSNIYCEKVYLYNSDGHSAGSWGLYECVHGTLTYRDKLYIIHGGEWFCLNKDYVDEIDGRVADIENSTLILPGVKLREIEKDYNERAASGSGSEILCLDRKLIPHGHGRSKIEVCDLLSKNCALICVKPWGDSSGSLSHLFQQALVSAKLIVRDLDFRKKVADVLDGDFLLSWNMACNENGYEVALVVLRGPTKDKLPFFAKLAFVSCADALREMRFKPTYLAIREDLS
ncbi:DUF6119 family protein [Rhodanobacter koreensis]